MARAPKASPYDHVYGAQGHVFGPQHQECTHTRVTSSGYRSGDVADFFLAGRKIDMDARHANRRGINLLIIDPVTHNIVKSVVYDTWTDKNGACAEMKKELDRQEQGMILLFAVKETGVDRLTTEALIAMRACGVTIDGGRRNQGYACITVKGSVAVAEKLDWSCEIEGQLPRKLVVAQAKGAPVPAGLPVATAKPLAAPTAAAAPAAEVQDSALRPLLMKARKLAMEAHNRPLNEVEEEGTTLQQQADSLRLSADAKFLRTQLNGFVEEAIAVAGPPKPPKFEVETKEVVPDPPASLKTVLEKMPDEMLQSLKENPPALDDWILTQPQAVEYLARAKEMCEKNGEFARSLLAKEAELSEAEIMESTGRDALEPRRQHVERLLVQRDEIMKKQSPDQIVTMLTQQAAAEDEEAENLLSDAMDGGEMDEAALTNFKQQYMAKKTEKHWRLAVKAGVAK